MEIKDKWISEAKINNKDYVSLYKQSIENNRDFWNKQGDRISWYSRYTKINNVKYSSKDVSIKWYEDGKLNVSYNCIDRHAKKKS